MRGVAGFSPVWLHFHFDCQKSWFGDDFAPDLQYRRDETHIFAFNALYYVNGVKMTTQKLAKTLRFFNVQATRVVPSSSKHAIVDCWLSLLCPLLDFRSQIGQITLPSQILNIEI